MKARIKDTGKIYFSREVQYCPSSRSYYYPQELRSRIQFSSQPIEVEIAIDHDAFLYKDNVGYSYLIPTCDIEIINENITNKNMNITEKFVLAMTKEPQKSFRKAGITNGDDLLTSDGEKIFLTWLLTKNADAFKAEVVDDLLKEKDEK